MRLSDTVDGLSITGDAGFPVNNGSLCIKGWTAAEPLRHPDRLLRPLSRNQRGVLVPVDWDAALDRTVQAIEQVSRRHGSDAVGVFGGGSLTNEKAYLLGKFARLAVGTSNIDYNGRFCMSSAAAAGIKAFGLDRGLPFPLEDIASAEAILLAGGNLAETMPPIMQYLDAQRAAGGQLIVTDPRRTPTADAATLHLKPTPGTDAAVAHGILHILIRERLVDEDYIARRTQEFSAVKALVSTYWPERVERITGIPEPHLIRAARILGTARTALVLTGRGIEQQAQGFNNTLSYINIALALGLVGTPGSGYGCVTGQGNGQGGREHGQKADQLPGYRKIDDPEARAYVASVWGVDQAKIPGPGLSAYELLDSIGQPGGLRALLVFGSNVVVSAPNAIHIEKRLRDLEFLAVADFLPSETSQLADVVLPVAQWAEEDGTMTNLEGRVIRRRQAIPAPEGVRTDTEVIQGLAQGLGKRSYFGFASAEEVFDELRRASRGGPADYSGISYAKIDEGKGVYWPCPSDDHPGTPRLFLSSFPTSSGRARFHAVAHAPSAEEPDDEFPLYLTTGRVLAQYQSGTQTRRVARLNEITGAPFAEMHPGVAKRYGVTVGASIDLSTRRGSARFTVKLNHGMRDDTVFVPFHWGGVGSANRLTNPALDPTSRMPEFKVCAVRIEPRRPS